MNDPRPGGKSSEFAAFLASEERLPPSGVVQGVRDQIRRGLEPPVWAVFSKMTLIHVFTGSASLALCPQFGLGLGHGGMGLMNLWMRFGDYGCMVGCGATFMGGSLLVAALALRPEEVRRIREYRMLQLSLLGLFSLAALACAGETILLGLGAAWLLGSIAGAWISLEAGWWTRRALVGAHA